MVRRRVRIRYCKHGDLRLLGHRDLARAWERVFRRAGVGLRMSEGFHPKPRLSFPSALAVGVCGAAEVLEAEITCEGSAAELAAALARCAPEGLAVTTVEWLPAGTPPSQVRRVVYELPVPRPWPLGLAERVARWPGEGPTTVDRGQGRRPIDLAALVEDVELDGNVLRMRIRVTPQGTARPREVLAALGLEDGEQQGFHLTRTVVELEPNEKAKS
ncbi:MAG TPA: TIGR03936 family radical SAM-associated protein [Pirellulales bacterium]|nr:TIGR03936 family radical SAM-associated protein [Pirellulales bacterium]